MDFMKSNDNVLDEPESQVSVNDLGDSSVDLILKPWTEKDKYWLVKFRLTKGIFKAYNEADIEIPYPQRDIHVDGELMSD